MVVSLIVGDVREKLCGLKSKSVHCCVTSPPYFGLRDYGIAGQIGLEASPAEYVAELVAVFREVRRVLRDDGTLWLNLGDSYNAAGREGHGTRIGFKQGTNRASANGADKPRSTAHDLKPKDLLGIPWRVAFALQADGWYLRSSIIWHKPNPMPESVTDRPTSAHENIFLLAKSERYFFDADAVKEPCAEVTLNDSRKGAPVTRDYEKANEKLPGYRKAAAKYFGGSDAGRNIRNVWTVATQPFSEAHFATFPPALIEPCIKAGCPLGGTVLDPFGGAGTVAVVANRLGRDTLLIELNPKYAAMTRRRLRKVGGLFAPDIIETQYA